jgi:glucose 1-dehydrogenase
LEEIRRDRGSASATLADVSREDAVKEMFERTVKRHGTLDILVSNAGVQRDAPFTEMSVADWQQVLDINLTGAFLCAREAAREFLRRGVVPDRSRAAGKIVFTTSVHQQIPWLGHVNYAVAKSGLEMLMKTVAQELAERKVRVNAVAPGAIKTDINRSSWETEEASRELLGLIPYGRLGEPADIGPAVVWLASDESDYVTGTTLFVDGGMLLYPGFRTGG